GGPAPHAREPVKLALPTEDRADRIELGGKRRPGSGFALLQGRCDRQGQIGGERPAGRVSLLTSPRQGTLRDPLDPPPPPPPQPPTAGPPAPPRRAPPPLPHEAAASPPAFRTPHTPARTRPSPRPRIRPGVVRAPRTRWTRRHPSPTHPAHPRCRSPPDRRGR